MPARQWEARCAAGRGRETRFEAHDFVLQDETTWHCAARGSPAGVGFASARNYTVGVCYGRRGAPQGRPVLIQHGYRRQKVNPIRVVIVGGGFGAVKFAKT